MMNSFKTRILMLFLIAYLGSCGISHNITEIQSDAETAYASKNYQKALDHYENLIELKSGRNNVISAETYYRAGISAWKTGNNIKAAKYMELAVNKGFENEKCFYILVKAYKSIDNLSLEMSGLRSYITRYPDGEHIGMMKKRLFEAYFETANYNAALEIWPDLKEKYANDPDIINKYFLMQKESGNEDILKKTANKLIKLDANNINALEYLGEHHFWKAEDLYQQEMIEYENNKTRKQYRQLLDALDVINEHFKISRVYFENLFETNPSPYYATFLRNIALRFGNEEKADYYNKKSQIETP